MPATIALLTDFGSRDPFVGIMKGVIVDINPDVQLIDLNHQIPPGDIRRAAINLWRSAAFFPKGTIFLVVVDPGVGTHRRPVIIQTEDFTFVGPDNGVFSYVVEGEFEAWTLSNPKLGLPNPGMTFHGRDLFAPAAAHASRGIAGADFGDAVPSLVRLPEPKLESLSPELMRGEILHADHFGNLLTSLGTFTPEGSDSWKFQPWIGDAQPIFMALMSTQLQLPNGDFLSWVNTFGEIPEGECAALIGSSGLIEIAANRASAADLLQLTSGDMLTLHIP